MKICITADVHVGVPGKLNDIMWSLNKIRTHCVQHSIEYIIVAGDLLHDRESIRSDDLNSLVTFLDETDKEYGIKVIAFPGNHDMYMKNSWDINHIRSLDRYLHKSYHKISVMNLGGVRFFIVPFMHYEKDYMKVIHTLAEKHEEGDVILTHIGVKTACINTCFLLKSWSIVSFEDTPFDRVYTGHFHTHQKVGNNVWYPGSPIPFKFDEGDVDHGFFVFDTETRTHEFVSIWAGEKSNDAPPQFLTLDDDSISSKSTAEITGNIVRVALSKEYSHNQLAEIRKSLSDLGAKDVRWMHLTAKEDKDNIEIAQNASKASNLFERFMSADKDGTKDLNPKLLLKCNKDIVSEGDKSYDESYR